MSSSALSIRDVSVAYGDVTAVRNVAFEVESGSFAALLGPSGCGKTSLLRAIAGFEPLVSGEIAVGGVVVASPTRSALPERRRVGLLFQNGALFPHMTVAKNVRYGVQTGAEGEEHARHALEVAGLADLAARYPDELSGGQQQRVALARAIAARPALILLDEPFANLDAVLRDRLRDDVRTILARERITALLVTHDQEEALSSADTVAVMSNGELLQHGRPNALYCKPASLEVARFIGDSQLIDCVVRDGEIVTELGRFTTDAPSGAAVLLVRPEQIRLREGDQGAEATLLEQRYHGHDRLLRFRLEASGTEFTSRALADDVPLGRTARVMLRHSEYTVFAGAQAVPFTARVA